MPHPFSDVSAFRRDPLGFFTARGQTASAPLERLNLGFSPVYLVTDPALVKPILKAPEADIDKGKLIHKLRSVVGESSLTLSGETHAKRRKALHSQLARGVASHYVPQIAAIYRRALAQVAKRSSFDVHALTAPLAMRAVCTVLFGHNTLTSSEEAALIAAVHSVEDDLASSMFRLLPEMPWTILRKRRQLRDARRIMGLIVDEAQKRAKPGTLVEALRSTGLSSAEMRDEVLMLLVTGHHTTGSVTAFALWHLAQDPFLANRIAVEAQELADETGEIRASKLSQASVSLGFTREILRLYPSAYWFSREVKRDLDLGGRSLKAGASLLVSPWHLHRDPRFWSTPEAFDPDRSHSGPAYVPFGAGPRACVGIGLALLEIQLLVLEVAATFELRAVADVSVVRPKPSVTLIPPKIELTLVLRDGARAHSRLQAA